MKQKIRTGWTTVCLVAMVAGVGLVGCEDTSDPGISVTPQSASFDVSEPSTNSVVFTATPTHSASSQNGTNAVSETSAFLYPLVWTVSDPALGNIVASGGDNAVYTRTSARGSNTIRVRDQGESTGVAVVTQY
jgi:hypothetical protein